MEAKMKLRCAPLALWFLAQATGLAADPPRYLGHWSNGRGETLTITASTIQFGEDQTAKYRDVTRATDDNAFELQITGGRISAFGGSTLGLVCEKDSMEMTVYASHGDYMEEKAPQSVVIWYQDADEEEDEADE